MEEDLRITILRYAETLPDGSHLKDIAVTTAKELARTNPFGRNNPNKPGVNIELMDIRSKKRFISIKQACNVLGLSHGVIVWELSQVLDKYGLKAL